MATVKRRRDISDEEIDKEIDLLRKKIESHEAGGSDEQLLLVDAYEHKIAMLQAQKELQKANRASDIPASTQWERILALKTLEFEIAYYKYQLETVKGNPVKLLHIRQKMDELVKHFHAMNSAGGVAAHTAAAAAGMYADVRADVAVLPMAPPPAFADDIVPEGVIGSCVPRIKLRIVSALSTSVPLADEIGQGFPRLQSRPVDISKYTERAAKVLAHAESGLHDPPDLFPLKRSFRDTQQEYEGILAHASEFPHSTIATFQSVLGHSFAAIRGRYEALLQQTSLGAQGKSLLNLIQAWYADHPAATPIQRQEFLANLLLRKVAPCIVSNKDLFFRTDATMRKEIFSSADSALLAFFAAPPAPAVDAAHFHAGLKDGTVTQVQFDNFARNEATRHRLERACIDQIGRIRDVLLHDSNASFCLQLVFSKLPYPSSPYTVYLPQYDPGTAEFLVQHVLPQVADSGEIESWRTEIYQRREMYLLHLLDVRASIVSTEQAITGSTDASYSLFPFYGMCTRALLARNPPGSPCPFEFPSTPEPEAMFRLARPFTDRSLFSHTGQPVLEPGTLPSSPVFANAGGLAQRYLSMPPRCIQASAYIAPLSLAVNSIHSSAAAAFDLAITVDAKNFTGGTAPGSASTFRALLTQIVEYERAFDAAMRRSTNKDPRGIDLVLQYAATAMYYVAEEHVLKRSEGAPSNAGRRVFAISESRPFPSFVNDSPSLFKFWREFVLVFAATLVYGAVPVSVEDPHAVVTLMSIDQRSKFYAALEGFYRVVCESMNACTSDTSRVCMWSRLWSKYPTVVPYVGVPLAEFMTLAPGEKQLFGTVCSIRAVIQALQRKFRADPDIFPRYVAAATPSARIETNRARAHETQQIVDSVSSTVASAVRNGQTEFAARVLAQETEGRHELCRLQADTAFQFWTSQQLERACAEALRACTTYDSILKDRKNGFNLTKAPHMSFLFATDFHNVIVTLWDQPFIKDSTLSLDKWFVSFATQLWTFVTAHAAWKRTSNVVDWVKGESVTGAVRQTSRSDHQWVQTPFVIYLAPMLVAALAVPGRSQLANSSSVYSMAVALVWFVVNAWNPRMPDRDPVKRLFPLARVFCRALKALQILPMPLTISDQECYELLAQPARWTPASEVDLRGMTGIQFVTQHSITLANFVFKDLNPLPPVPSKPGQGGPGPGPGPGLEPGTG